MHRPVAIGFLTIVMFSGAAAQSSNPAPVDADDAAATFQRIEVTSTKRPAQLRDIVGSVSADTGRSLERSGAQGLDDFIRLTPGVQIIQVLTCTEN